jgi:KRAB domain-containing zinc finger protein
MTSRRKQVNPTPVVEPEIDHLATEIAIKAEDSTTTVDANNKSMNDVSNQMSDITNKVTQDTNGINNISTEKEGDDHGLLSSTNKNNNNALKRKRDETEKFNVDSELDDDLNNFDYDEHSEVNLLDETDYYNDGEDNSNKRPLINEDIQNGESTKNTLFCRICSSSFASLADLRSHTYHIHAKGQLNCEDCPNICFTSQIDLEEHYFNVHGMSRQEYQLEKATQKKGNFDEILPLDKDNEYNGCNDFDDFDDFDYNSNDNNTNRDQSLSTSQLKESASKDDDTLNSQLFICRICELTFKFKRSLDVHIQLHKGTRRYCCPHCDLKFARKEHLARHVKAHDNSKPFLCSICSCGFDNTASLRLHIFYLHNALKHSCDICSVNNFYTHLELEGHIYYSHGLTKRQYKEKKELGELSTTTSAIATKLPNETTTTNDDIIQFDHNNNDDDEDEEDVDDILNDISNNDKIQAEAEKLRIFMAKVMSKLTIKSNGTFECPICFSCFKRRQGLRIHVQLHSGIKIYSCKMCDLTFSKLKYLKLHVDSHSNLRPFVCSTCLCSYDSELSLIFHTSSQHDFSRNRCNDCPNLQFGSLLELQGHIYDFHGRIPTQLGSTNINNDSNDDIIIEEVLSPKNHQEKNRSNQEQTSPFSNSNNTMRNDPKQSNTVVRSDSNYCEMCNARFTSHESIVAHMRISHPNVPFQQQQQVLKVNNNQNRNQPVDDYSNLKTALSSHLPSSSTNGGNY